MPFYALVFNLCSKVDLILTRAFRLVRAQSVQFSKIAKKTEHGCMPISFSLKGSTVLINHEIKNGGHRTRAAELQKVCTTCIFSD